MRKHRGIVIGAGFCLMVGTPLGVPPERQSQNVLTFDDFSSATTGEFPAEWSWRQDREYGDVEKARKDKVDIFRYVTAEENGNKYLHVRDEHRPGHSISVYVEAKKYGWRIKEHPILSWRWRVNEIPPGADERYTEKNDTPASVSVVYGRKFPFVPITIKYVWSSTLPVGAVAYREGRGRPYTIVLGTGTERLGEWITIERNVFEDYVEIFGKDPPDRPEVILLSSDANRTPGAAADADYDDFKALSAYSPGFPKEPFTLLKQYMADNN